MKKLRILDRGYAASGIASITWEVPQETDVLILMVSCAVVTDATVANRYFRLRTRGPSGLYDLGACHTKYAHAASTSITHFFLNGYQDAPGSLGAFMIHDFPGPGLFVPSGGWFQFGGASSNQAGDTIGPLVISWIPAFES